jgi:hypothetical protein
MPKLMHNLGQLLTLNWLTVAPCRVLHSTALSMKSLRMVMGN